MRTATILAGGRGTRLRSVIADRPKVLAEIGGRPFLDYLFAQLERAGVRRVVLCTGHLADQVERTFGRVHRALELIYSPEPRPLGTAGALALALPLLAGEDPVLVLNGDSYCEVDLPAFHRWHIDGRASNSIVLARMLDVTKFGRVRLSGDEIVSFEEKTGLGPGWVNAGIYLLSRGVLEGLSPNEPASLEIDVFPRLCAGFLRGFRCEKPVHDIGTPASYRTTADFLGTRARSRGAP